MKKSLDDFSTPDGIKDEDIFFPSCKTARLFELLKVASRSVLRFEITKTRSKKRKKKAKTQTSTELILHSLTVEQERGREEKFLIKLIYNFIGRMKDE